MKSSDKGKIGENAVNKIAFDTYLKYWCYPNPKDERGTKKEVCDLLILFKEIAIIFSIKNYSFKGNYERYFHSTLDKAVSQVQGAERKLFGNPPQKIFIKHYITGEIEFDPSKYTKLQRIVVNLNTNPLFYPGGKTTSKNQFIHIFNWSAFLKLVLELNTIPDFIRYLEEREKAFKKKEVVIMHGKENDWDISSSKQFAEYPFPSNDINKTFIILSGNEMDLLADYYSNNNKFNNYFYSSEYNGGLFKLDGNWDDYINREEVNNKKYEERVSYFVDELVRRDVLYKNDSQNIEIAVELLSLSRFERRIIGKRFFKSAEQFKNTGGRSYTVLNNFVVCYLFYEHAMKSKTVNKLIRIAMEGYSYWENYKTKKIVMIATSNKLDHFKFALIKDIKPFSKKHEENLKYNLKLLNWFQNINKKYFTVKEYP